MSQALPKQEMPVPSAPDEPLPLLPPEESVAPIPVDPAQAVKRKLARYQFVSHMPQIRAYTRKPDGLLDEKV